MFRFENTIALNTTNFTYLLANPQKITSEDLEALDFVIKKHPYFQSARALQLKGLKNQDSFLYNDALKLVAAHTTDRDILFEYITSERFIQNEISQNILQHDGSINEIEVVSEDISEEVNNANDQVEMQKAEDILNPNLFERKIQSVTNLVETKNEEPEDTLQPDKPLEFTKSDTHSFSEWLKLTKAKPIERSEKVDQPKEEKSTDASTVALAKEEASTKEEISAQVEKERKSKLIDRFIQERPKIIPPEAPAKSVKKDSSNNLVAAFGQSSESLMTETLAKVYLQQKNYKKAIQAYKILILKNPEKSGSFADQIRAIEKLINSEQS
ncbi:MAG: hypothetical protein ACTIJ9_00645 [Aequorivita sp.]